MCSNECENIMTYLFDLIEQYGLILVFANVLMEQLGIPLPAYPTLVITGALLDRGDYSVAALLLTAVGASLIADYAWFSAGRSHGRKVTAVLCRISLSPDSCVRQTEMIYQRWGAPSLLVAKFIPGFASVASALAGTVGTRRATFILFDGLGAILWAGSAIYLGTLFRTTIADLLSILEALGKWGGVLLLLALASFIASKWWQRYRFLKSLRMARISVEELNQLLEQGQAPLIVDVRSALSQPIDRIPGAVVISVDDLSGANSEKFEKLINDEVIVYCACPNEASAAVVAKKLMQRGYTRVRPLAGGIDAWIAAGYSVES
jgi:membrane protein DedA with SNARE-associated domain/rhodanese-related sulfurtransferase